MGKCIICEVSIGTGSGTFLTEKGCKKINEVSLRCGGNISAKVQDEVHFTLLGNKIFLSEGKTTKSVPQY